MTGRRDLDRLLRWYPEPWRRRYGSELLALLEDSYGHDGPGWRARLGLLKAGTAERLRASGLGGAAIPPAEGVRAGSLVVLWAWAVFAVAGAGFANRADNWQAAVRAGATWWPAVGYGVVFTAGIVGGAIVLLAAALCARPVIAFLASGGWRAVRGRVLAAAVMLAVTVAATRGLALWAHQLSPAQRNGGLWTYSALFLVVAFLATVTIGCLTGAATAVARRLELPPAVLRCCGRLAVALTAVMAAAAVGTVAWWAAMAAGAHGFFAGSSPAAEAPYPLVGVGLLMVLGLTLAVTGARRTLASLRRWGSAG